VSDDQADKLRQEVARRVDAIEAAYELMLAYAAQGAASDAAVSSGAQLRDFLQRFDDALAGLAETFAALITAEGRAADVYEAFLDVLSRDALATRAGLRVVRAQPGISSQLIDNLNASIHVRALLTDVFLIDELLKGEPARPGDAAT
jgi:hypothetical protein